MGSHPQTHVQCLHTLHIIIHQQTHIQVLTCVHTYYHAVLYTHTHTHTHTHPHTHTHIHTHTHTHTHTPTHPHTHTHTHTQRERERERENSHADHNPNACDHPAAHGLLLCIVHLSGTAAAADHAVVDHQHCEDDHGNQGRQAAPYDDSLRGAQGWNSITPYARLCWSRGKWAWGMTNRAVEYANIPGVRQICKHTRCQTKHRLKQYIPHSWVLPPYTLQQPCKDGPAWHSTIPECIHILRWYSVYMHTDVGNEEAAASCIDIGF